MARQGSEPRAVRVMGVDGKKSIEVYELTLRDVLLADDVRDLPVVVVSVVGAFRTGKSFLLNFLLRYLRSGGKQKWLGEPNIPLRGFHWTKQSERDTEGIMVWSEVFKVTKPSGEKVAVLLMDTQGTCDRHATKAETAAFFSMSSMLSSVQVYNISKNIQEDHIENLQFFTEYAKMARKDVGTTPLQKLLFLVRDWEFTQDAPFGKEGGDKILRQKLLDFEDMPKETQELHKDVRASFETIECFLMPHPGMKVIKNKEFCGHIEDLEDDFKEHLQTLARLLLAPDKLLVKRINGDVATCQDLMAFFQEYGKKFSDGSLPTPQSIYEANARLTHNMAKDAALELYKQEMKTKRKEHKGHLTTELLITLHNSSLESARHEFRNHRKLGSQQLSTTYEDQLTKVLVHIKSDDVNRLRFQAKKFRGCKWLCEIQEGVAPPITSHQILLAFPVVPFSTPVQVKTPRDVREEDAERELKNYIYENNAKVRMRQMESDLIQEATALVACCGALVFTDNKMRDFMIFVAPRVINVIMKGVECHNQKKDRKSGSRWEKDEGASSEEESEKEKTGEMPDIVSTLVTSLVAALDQGGFLRDAHCGVSAQELREMPVASLSPLLCKIVETATKKLLKDDGASGAKEE